MLANVAEPCTHIGEDKTQTTLIANLARQDFGLLHVMQDAIVLSQRGEDDPRVEPEIDGLGLGRATVGQVPQNPKRLLERGHGLPIRGSHGRAHGGFAEIRDRPVPQLASHGMVGEQDPRVPSRLRLARRVGRQGAIR